MTVQSTNVAINEEQLVAIQVREQRIFISSQDAEELRDMLIEFFNNHYGKTGRQN